MAVDLNFSYQFLWLFVIYYFTFLNMTVTSEIQVNLNNTVTNNCILLDNSDLFMTESIRRNTFLYKLTIYGQIIKFSDIPNYEICPGSIVITEIFATDKIIIDQNYRSDKSDVTFIIAAPIWKVVGKRIISLKGHDGTEISTSKRKVNSAIFHDDELPRAKDGNITGNRNGENGKPGNSGGPGGHFHGIVVHIINERSLTIDVTGGNGGRGQNGGIGAVGIDGSDFKITDEHQIKQNGDVDGFNVILRRKVKPPKGEDYLGDGMQQVILGESGTNGGNGGHGGPGGNRGFPGIYALAKLQDLSCEADSIFQRVKLSKYGINGSGGAGGLAGNPGSDVILTIYNTDGNKTKIILDSYHYHNNDLLDGRNGLDGSNIPRNQEIIKHPLWQTFKTSALNFSDFLKTYSNISLNLNNLNEAQILFDNKASCFLGPNSNEDLIQ